MVFSVLAECSSTDFGIVYVQVPLRLGCNLLSIFNQPFRLCQSNMYIELPSHGISLRIFPKICLLKIFLWAPQPHKSNISASMPDSISESYWAERPEHFVAFGIQWWYCRLCLENLRSNEGTDACTKTFFSFVFWGIELELPSALQLSTIPKPSTTFPRRV